MSVTRYRASVCLALALVLLPVLAQAEERKRRTPRVAAVKKAEQLENERYVRQWKKPYVLLATASYIHQKCAAELGTSPQDQAFVAQKQMRSRQQFTAALDKAFVDRTKTPTPEDLKKDFGRYIDELPKQSISDTESVIKHRGCKNNAITAVTEYFEKLRVIEEPQAAPTAAAAAPATAAAPVATTPAAQPPAAAPSTVNPAATLPALPPVKP